MNATTLKAGRYAIHLGGPLRFYWVSYSPSDGTLQISDMRGGGEDKALVSYGTHTGLAAETIATAILRSGPRAARRRYGRELVECARCSADLTNTASRWRGYGPDCWQYIERDEQKEALFEHCITKYNDRWGQARPEFMNEPWLGRITVLPADTKSVVYFLWNADWDLLYVGKSKNGVAFRMNDHWAKDWGPCVRYAVEVQTEDHISDAEETFIHELHPVGNLQCRLCLGSIISATPEVNSELVAKLRADQIVRVREAIKNAAKDK